MDSPKTTDVLIRSPSHNREALKILSWNIHDASNGKEGRKIDDTEFAAIVTSCPIFCLQETKSKIFVPDYKCFNANRPNSRSGGLCIGVHRSIAKDVKEITSNCSDIQSVRIKLGSESAVDELVIINLYDSPEHSSYKKRLKSSKSTFDDDASTLDNLLDFTMNSIQNGRKVILAGDFNARTASLNNTIEEDTEALSAANPFSQRSHPCLNDRSSKDQMVNPRGKLLLDFLACANLTILNGSVLGDSLGEFTSVNYGGASVVDYVAVGADIKAIVKSFRVLDLCKFSDHKPSVTTLSLRHNITLSEEILRDLEDAPRKYKWPCEDNAELKFLLAMGDPGIKEKTETLATSSCKTHQDVLNLNNQIVELYHQVAEQVMPRKNASSRQKGPRHNKYGSTKKKSRMKPKMAWFDSECIRLKRTLNILAKKYGRSPLDKLLRDSYYDTRRQYRKMIRHKRSEFFENLCKDIETGNNICWKSFKALKNTKSPATSLDAFDMINFCKFFSELYGKKNIKDSKIAELQSKMQKNNICDDLTKLLDQDIKMEELCACIKATKKGKAVSEDLISNEFFKASTRSMLKAVLNLFNHCLSLSIYPWTSSVVTPLHKKGDIYDPNNYRAIAVASNLGKLFASILLKRLISFRDQCDPDTANQLGFCKDAQTADHIFTFSTCVEKYVTKKRQRLYTCFVDYAKAFDSICREALLYKLWKMGIQGRFFECIKFMYSNSSAKVKLLSKLSQKIDIICGTEQGHPMSPELFKCFVHQLSHDLNNIEGVKVPVLNDTDITHLLWADDLVLLALNKHSLQQMLDVLNKYCSEWGLTVNVGKTSVLVFNPTGRHLKESHEFKLGEQQIPSGREYCYLGITFTLSGSLKLTQQKLRQKALRSYFSLKSYIDTRHIRKSILFKLFDTLIVPVVSYGCQVWLPSTALFRNFPTNTSTNPETGNVCTLIAKDPLENLHLSLLKWTLGVRKSTSNAAIWGDTGRHPLGITLSKQVFNYKERLEQMVVDGRDCFARHAFEEQATLNLSWFSTLEQMQETIEASERKQGLRPSQIRKSLQKWFINSWETERTSNKKLSFYNLVKRKFAQETYLALELKPNCSKKIAQFRSSSHRFNVETGRYGEKRFNIKHRACRHCCSSDDDLLDLLYELPGAYPVIEDEHHILYECPLYEDLRENLHQRTRDLLVMREEPGEIFDDSTSIRDIGRFLIKVDERRFPKKNTK